MVIHFFTKGEKDAGSARQRAFLVAEELNKMGIRAVVHQPFLTLGSTSPWLKKIKALWRYLKILKGIKKNDLVFLQRTVYNKYFLLLIVIYKFLFKPKIIFDLDDALYLQSLQLFLKIKILTKLADAVIMGSHALAEWAKKYNSNVSIIPTSVRFENYSKYSKEYPSVFNKLNIGWIGGAIDQFENLKLLVPIFKKLIEEKVPVKFTLIGALKYKPVYELFQGIEGLETEIIDSLDWANPEMVPSHIQKFDIGVMPLIDNKWNRGKCSFKAIEYMTCGVVTICSPVGENNYLIRDGENGFLADETEDWVAKIKKLIKDPSLIKKLGKAGQRTIEKEYSYKVTIPKLIKIIQKL